MKYPYFRGLEADRYSFYRVPKALIKVDLFEKMSGDAKLLYAVLLDRMNLSLKNGWQDENGNAYIICTIDEIMDSIRCARQKAVKLLDELEHEYQLIERRRQGLGKPNLLYVKDLYAGLSQSNYWKYENQTSGGLKSELPGVWKSNGSKFEFSYDRILQSGMTTKDFIAPTSFLFKSGKDFQMGDTIGAVSYLNILAPELTDKVLAEFLDMDKNLVVSIHVQSVDQLKAIKLIKGKITDLDRMKIEEQKKAVRSGYDMEIIPSDLATYGGEAKKILDDLQSRNERMFLITVLFLNAAKTKQELDSAVFQTAGIAQKFNCTLNRLDYMQEQGLMSSLPLANNLVPIKRALTTTSTAIFVPFTTQELFMEGDSLYYGLNAVSNNMIMADRK